MTTCKYRPLGTRIVLEILPIESKSTVLLPNGATNPKERQTFKVIAVGGEVNDDKYSLHEGEIVIIAAHNSDLLPLDEEKQLIMADRRHVVAAIASETHN